MNMLKTEKNISLKRRTKLLNKVQKLENTGIQIYQFLYGNGIYLRNKVRVL